jgi:tRNA pseudouridine55 synthase
MMWYCVAMALLTTYKNVGETPLQALERLRGEKNLGPDTKMTYAGRLDPAAEGLLLVLTDHDVHQKDSFLTLDKTYEFEVCFGLTTDTLDSLGLVTQTNFTEQDMALPVLGVLDSFVGEFDWEYPAFSSKPVDGKPMFQHAREDAGVDIPKRTMKIYTLEMIGRSYKSLHELKDQIQVIFEEFGDRKVGVVKFRARVGSGTYIRVLAQKIGEALDIPSFALSIKRTSVGTMEISN